MHSKFTIFFASAAFFLNPLKAEEPAFYSASESCEFENYDEDFVELVEMIYGEGTLSQGGMSSIDEMFSDIDLKGLRLLDIGSGLGMYDIHLAKNHACHIVAIDPQEKLVEKANAKLKANEGELKGSVEFLFMENPSSLDQFADESFDIVFSKETILHVSNKIKQSYFNEIYRVVKPGGKIVILDWMHTSSDYSENLKKMMELDGLLFQLLTPLEYRAILETAGFANIGLVDKTEAFADYSQTNIDTIEALKDEICKRFGQATYEYCVISWGLQRDAFRNKDLLVGLFTADKN